MANKISTQKKDTFLSFRLADEIFAVNVIKVLEVLEIQRITKVPNTPPYMKGVINFRGEILPVIDTRMKFTMPEAEQTTKTVIVVLDLTVRDKQIMIGAMADSVKDVIEINLSEIKPVPEISSNYNTEFIIGMWKSENGFIMILDFDKIFSVEELRLVNESSQSLDIDIVENIVENNVENELDEQS